MHVVVGSVLIRDCVALLLCARTGPSGDAEDTPELNLVLDYYRRALAATAAAVEASTAHDSGPSGTDASLDEGSDDGDASGQGFLSKRSAYTPLVLPSAAARCMDGVSRLSAGPRRMLCLCSDKVCGRNTVPSRPYALTLTLTTFAQAYTHQRELASCDAFDISHEGSFSLMVNAHALGMLTRVWGGTALHTTQTVAEQGARTTSAAWACGASVVLVLSDPRGARGDSVLQVTRASPRQPLSSTAACSRHPSDRTQTWQAPQLSSAALKGATWAQVEQMPVQGQAHLVASP